SNVFSDFVYKFPAVTFVHLHWVDFVGILRSRVLPVAHCLKLSNNERVLRISPCATRPVYGGPHPEGFIGAAGSNSLIPDWASLLLLSDIHASVMCNVSEEGSFHSNFDTKKPFQRCPRSELQRVVDLAGREHSLLIQAGVELEFYLWDENEDPIESMEMASLGKVNTWSTASALRTQQAACVEACALRLQKSGVYVEQYHAEQGFQQFEISLGPLPVLAAADQCVQAQEIVRRTAIAHGYKAIFLPKPFATFVPTGLHIHLSIASSQQDKPQEEIRRVERYFLAGIMQRLPLLCAFGMGSEASYRRVNKRCLGEWVSWGTENRNNPVRQIKPGHWELKCIDSTCNIFLAIAAYIAAGFLGVKQSTELTLGDCRVSANMLDEQMLEKLHIKTPLPKTLEGAIGILERSPMEVDHVLTQQMFAFYVMTKRKE
ncbi:hypothetical protein B0O99DRAFT_457222, partial [Bisporella sp. PMI_857]